MPRVSYPCEDFRAGKSDDPENENMDFCRKCFRGKKYLRFVPQDVDREKFLDVDCVHPEYGEDDYDCLHCGVRLNNLDN